MRVRAATTADEALLRELWEEFEAEIPAPPEWVETWDEEWEDVSADIGGRGAVVVAEDGEGIVGSVRAKMLRGEVWHIATAFVRPRGRKKGVLKDLLREVIAAGRERGASRVTLNVQADNPHAVAVWRRLGFQDDAYYLSTTVDELESRLGEADRPPSQGAIYVQTDDHDAVERAVGKYLPRIGRSASTTIHQPSNGWSRVEDELAGRDLKAMRRLARELSLALGAIVLTIAIEEGAVVRYALWDRGGVADEYASLPEHFAPLPPGDVIALAANPTVAHRLTGADPARIRAVAKNGNNPDELPPPDELAAELAEALGVVWAS